MNGVVKSQRWLISNWTDVRWINSENITTVVLMLGLALYPLMFGTFAVLNLTYMLAFCILSLSVTLVWGYAGIFSMGQPAFFGIAGYAYGVLAINADLPVGTMGAAVFGIGIAALAALALGYFMFYGGVNDVFASLLTWSVALVGFVFLNQTADPVRWHIGEALLGGYNGMRPIPSLATGVGSGGGVLFGVSLYYFVVVLFVGVLIGVRLIRTSRWGYILFALQDNRMRTKTFGYNVRRHQMLVFGLGGALAGLSGVLYTGWSNFIAPDVMSMTACALPIVFVAAGGRGNATASAVSTIALMYLTFKLSASGTKFSFVILGAVLVLVIVAVPNGIVVGAFKWMDTRIVLPLVRAAHGARQGAPGDEGDDLEEMADVSRGH